MGFGRKIGAGKLDPVASCEGKKMPVNFPFKINSISADQFNAIDFAVMGQVFASQNEIGRLADEQVYRSDVANRLAAIELRSDEEIPIEVTFGSFAKTLYLDLVVDGKVIYELKTVSSLTSRHLSQLLTYLYLLDLPRGKLINFSAPRVEAIYVNAPIPREQRVSFTISDVGYCGPQDFLRLIIELVRDWGTSLSVSLYHQAIICMLGGKEKVTRMLPLARDGTKIANQRFHLLGDNDAFGLTALEQPDNNYAGQLRRILDLSPLKCIHWVNIGRHRLTFQTVHRT